MRVNMDVEACGICGGVPEEQCGDPCVAPGSIWYGIENPLHL